MAVEQHELGTELVELARDTEALSLKAAIEDQDARRYNVLSSVADTLRGLGRIVDSIG